MPTLSLRDGNNNLVHFESAGAGTLNDPHRLVLADGGIAETISHGVAGVPFTSADASAADLAVTDAPSSGKRLVFTDIVVSVDTDMAVSFKSSSGGMVISGPHYLTARSGPVQLTLRGKFAHPEPDQKLWVRTSVSGNISVDPYYYSEAYEYAQEEEEMALGTRVAKTDDLSTTGADLFIVTGIVQITALVAELPDSTTCASYQMRIKDGSATIFSATDLSIGGAGNLYTRDAQGNLVSEAVGTYPRFVAIENVPGIFVGTTISPTTLESTHLAGDEGDSINWILFYVPISAGASVVAA